MSRVKCSGRAARRSRPPQARRGPSPFADRSLASAKLGRELTNEEFETEHWVEPASEIISGTSIFDPVLCELIYRWFCPPGGLVLDPFAGGSVRGIVAAILGREYIGYDLSERQVEANRAQAAEICNGVTPVWVHADAKTLDVPQLGADMVFSCPPYANLERYSDDPLDLSTMPYGAFIEAYREIIAKACAQLQDDRFACFVVGEVRDSKGRYRGFVPDTVRAFQDAGLALYNEMILVTAVGSLPIRVRKQFEGARKVGKTHQNVLVFLKGDPKRATAAAGPVEFGDIDDGYDADDNARRSYDDAIAAQRKAFEAQQSKET